MTNTNGPAASVKPAPADNKTKEEQLIALFMELTGPNESEARAVYGFLDTEQLAHRPAVD